MGAVGSVQLDGVFPGAARYRELGTVPWPGGVRERGADWETFPYRERHLQCVWADESIRPARLVSAAGEEVTVCSPGEWNLEAGPDFLGAVLVVGSGRRHITGDVEVHVRPGDWTSHEHGADPRYSGVVAHVTYIPGRLPDGALPAGTLEIPLRDALRSDPSFGFGDIDITSYPYAALPATPRPCESALAQRSQDFREELLDSAGEERLRLKTGRMVESIRERGEDQAFYEETMCALGYKHNRGAFRRLARALPFDVLREEAEGNKEHGYSLLLGVAGLLPSSPSASWPEETRRFVRRLWDCWWRQESRWESQRLPADAWRLAGVRPQNHPRRRLAAAAALFAGGKAPVERLAELDVGSPGTWFERAGEMFTDAGRSGFWGRHLGLSSGRTESDVAVVGKRRAAAILSNVVIPFLAAAGVPVEPLLRRLPPEQDNSVLRRTAFALFGHDHNTAMYESGLRQQGLLQVFHDFCLPDRSGCADCALVRALDDTRERS